MQGVIASNSEDASPSKVKAISQTLRIFYLQAGGIAIAQNNAVGWHVHVAQQHGHGVRRFDLPLKISLLTHAHVATLREHATRPHYEMVD